jgi:hypothetical protein
VLLALLLGAAPGQRTWRYSLLTELSFPSLKKLMWSCPDRKIDDGTKTPDALNLMGADGWELVAVLQEGGREPFVTVFYFKRPQ